MRASVSALIFCIGFFGTIAILCMRSEARKTPDPQSLPPLPAATCDQAQAGCCCCSQERCRNLDPETARFIRRDG